MQTLVGRPQAKLRVEEPNSASRMKELKQKVNNLEVDKLVCAGKALQPPVATGSSDAVLRAQKSQLRKQIAAKDATISQQ